MLIAPSALHHHREIRIDSSSISIADVLANDDL